MIDRSSSRTGTNLPADPVFCICERILDQFRFYFQIERQVPEAKTDFSASVQAAKSLLQSLDIILSKADLVEKQSLQCIACGEREAVQEQLRKRHVFIDQPDTVSCRQPDFKAVIFGAAGAAAYMAHNGGRAVPVLIAVDLRTVADVHIFKILRNTLRR